MGVHFQNLSNESLRLKFNLSNDQTGCLITKISPVSPAFKVLLVNDIILSVEGTPVANDGSVPFRNGQRLYLNYLFTNKFVGESLDVQILRNGERMNVSFGLKSSTFLSLVPTKVTQPSFVIVGGLVFTRLTVSYLQEFATDDECWLDAAPRNLVYRALNSLRISEKEEVIVLSHVLADKINEGYTQMANLELLSLNGIKIENMKQLMETIQNCSHSSQFLHFEFSSFFQIAVLKVDLLPEANTRIQKEYSIPCLSSPDLVDILLAGRDEGLFVLFFLSLFCPTLCSFFFKDLSRKPSLSRGAKKKKKKKKKKYSALIPLLPLLSPLF
eukprot:TRINITY_DN4054_c0_g1_i17.p1 TRINITY_DN4054_c0_g1~~TRINITY_DN4054_c0_g1_i17.p1  ORF type:complete len:328 (-),score=71.05 TRINITY_DN4054_c0_g1_i17:14-997(-)